MSLPIKGIENKDGKLTIPSKVSVLNPNAAEFVPSAVRHLNGNNKPEDKNRIDIPGTSRKAVLDRTDSTISNNSDDEAHQYWRRQLPDDITPDFTAVGEDHFASAEELQLAGLSIHSLHLGNGVDAHQFNGSSGAVFANNLYADHLTLEDTAIKHVEFLALQFPGFSSESLAEFYYANGCDLNLTIEILTQLELQVDGGFNHNQNSKAVAAPNLNALDFPALPVADSQNEFSKYNKDNLQQNQNIYRFPSSIFRGTPDFASAVRKLALQDSGTWKYESNGSADGFGGSSGNAQLLSSSYKNHSKLAYEKKLQGFGTSRATPVWLETGEAVASMYSTSREEARDFARLRNACFQQAREAYLIGNKALAKELGDKGKWYNLQMKEAHANARETIFRQRNPGSPELHGYGRGQERMVDLHGLHVNEAIHVLKHELSIMKNAARSAGHRLHVLICVGTGHHTKGARTPARLPIAVEQYLLEEGLHYTQPQPGLLRVVVY
ncbi:hypothetical protein AXF42_Ash015045 [Apostasia shenzhenica]|uniref:Smr domain-containing protein n=1 Tax=Apostasia shenzhenica TaxID=1088818 RepID=A0A2I0B2Z5_9ASPA|nr:hypothetical protein AXF42_Ash015045 [Apostasia shenzhenica]